MIKSKVYNAVQIINENLNRSDTTLKRKMTALQIGATDAQRCAAMRVF